MNDPTSAIEACIQKLLTLLGCNGQIAIDNTVSPWRVTITTKNDSRHLIGIEGQHLRALQHVVRAIMRRHDAEVSFIIDINGYRSQHEEIVRSEALRVAQEAGRIGRTVVMRPMSPGDRRLVHTALAERSDIQTESLGEEPHRRVIIRPVFL